MCEGQPPAAVVPGEQPQAGDLHTLRRKNPPVNITVVIWQVQPPLGARPSMAKSLTQTKRDSLGAALRAVSAQTRTAQDLADRVRGSRDDRIREAHAAGMTQQDIAGETQLSQPMVGKIVRGETA